MGSSRPTDRTIGEATFLPQWMKGKLDTRFDYTDSTFSPPADDNFFYIRYPKQENTSSSSTTNYTDSFKSINKLFGNKVEESTAENHKNSQFPDISKHLTTSRGLPTNEETGPKIVVANSLKPKQHTDDEFRSDKSNNEGSRSIVQVANLIMSSKFGKVSSSDSSASTEAQHPAATESTIPQQQRKGSKSLPVTPIASPSSSPESRRRAYGNRFFAFAPESSERGRNGWILSSILGQSRELITPKIAEEDEQQMEPVPQRALNRKKSISSQNLTYFGTDEKPEVDKQMAQTSGHLSILQSKPSEFREMNFWSPTSM